MEADTFPVQLLFSIGHQVACASSLHEHGAECQWRSPGVGDERHCTSPDQAPSDYTCAKLTGAPEEKAERNGSDS